MKLGAIFNKLKDSNNNVLEEGKISYVLLLPKSYESVVTALEIK